MLLGSLFLLLLALMLWALIRSISDQEQKATWQPKTGGKSMKRSVGAIRLSRHCPYCRSRHSLQRAEGYHLGLVEEKEDGSKVISAEKGTPLIVVVCSVCGHLQLFAAGLDAGGSLA